MMQNTCDDKENILFEKALRRPNVETREIGEKGNGRKRRSGQGRTDHNLTTAARSKHYQ